MKKVVYTAHDGETAKYSKYVMKFVYDKGAIPINPFESMDYYMLTWLVHKGDKKKVLEDTINLMLHCDELWIFAEPSIVENNDFPYENLEDGVRAEIEVWIKKKSKDSIKFFSWKDVGIPKYTSGSKWNLK